MKRVMPHLGEDYFPCGFIGGMKDEIRPMVRMLKPIGLAHVIKIAKFQEQLLGYAKKINYFSKITHPCSKPNTSIQNPYSYKFNQPNQVFPYPPNPPDLEATINSKITLAAIKTQPNSSQISVNQTLNKTTLNPNPGGVRQSKPSYRCGEMYFLGH